MPVVPVSLNIFTTVFLRSEDSVLYSELPRSCEGVLTLILLSFERALCRYFSVTDPTNLKSWVCNPVIFFMVGGGRSILSTRPFPRPLYEVSLVYSGELDPLVSTGEFDLA